LICGILVYFKNLHLRFSGDHDLCGPHKFHKKNNPSEWRAGDYIGLQIGFGILGYSDNPITEQSFYILVANIPVFVFCLAEKT
jgi:hypothetical protein